MKIITNILQILRSLSEINEAECKIVTLKKISLKIFKISYKIQIIFARIRNGNAYETDLITM